MTDLRRKDIDDLLKVQKSQSINPSLWLQKGLNQQKEDSDKIGKDGETPKTKHLKEIADFTCDLYPKAFNRWFDLTSDGNRFSQTVMTLENRLLIGLTGNGALETGCSLSRNYGMPYIPGASVKGVVRAWAKKNLTGSTKAIEQLFGTYDSDQPDRVSGTVIFHDAWWVPLESTKPFVLDVVTTHHQAYYNGNQTEPSDKDSPVPNHLLAVRGSFLFVIEGDPEHVKLCQTMLTKALQDNGIGAKTAAGYGYMGMNQQLHDELQKEAELRLPPEVREKRELEAIQRQQRAENAKTVEDVCKELQKQYKTQSDNEQYRDKLEERIDYAIQSWGMEDRLSLAKCLNDIGYIPKNKKNKNHGIRKARLKQLRGEK